ncbi:MAG: hypothetical protein N3E46_09695 [Gemmataceae bacterium]|uniref:FtsH ternary system domain-containing protein n=1 Tax=Thermogemmata fonticola TaxID=2755323 RepID=A0A7V8VBQ5_9BACT|nr:hypothetical protein [Thermogemmata fonticola]MBA2225094.1 hypothetical protein [Thermogemmata fonticola]MCX8139944.1 hypothetical protein [Gemmataceae bacterium]GIW84453.1 MAG: hypothetical protein KatS3mg107_0113 [Gemmataceae bacterium]
MNMMDVPRKNLRVGVTPFENELLCNAKKLFLISKASSPHTQNWDYHSSPQQELSANADRLLKTILAKGTVEFLVKASEGWHESFLQHGQEKSGRLWERHPLAERTLHFSHNTLRLLIWWTSTDPKIAQAMREPPVDVKSLTPADEFVVWRIADCVQTAHSHRSESFKKLCSFRAFHSNPWIWLSMPHMLRTEISKHSLSQLDDMPWYAKANLVDSPSFARCFQGLRSVFLEALQNHLFQRLVKDFPLNTEDVEELVQRNVATYLIYRQFLLDAEQAGRPDLALFLLRAVARLTPAFTQLQDRRQNNVKIDEQIGRLRTVQERMKARQALIAPLTLINILHRWTLHYRNIGYWDEDYRIAQWWLRQWEEHRGDELVGRVHVSRANLTCSTPLAESDRTSECE